jgi:predicted  nucleic acid-binding Zn-ribbon protein
MKGIIKMLWGILVLLIGGASAYAAVNKSKEVKQLKKQIKNNKKDEKKVEKQIEELEATKTVSKKEVATLKRKLTKTKKEVAKMEKAYEEDDIESAADFLKKYKK